jgi:hypothetical protein
MAYNAPNFTQGLPGGANRVVLRDWTQSASTVGANMDGIVILRRGANGRDERYEFSYNECAEGRTEMNFLLRSGDTIIVP